MRSTVLMGLVLAGLRTPRIAAGAEVSSLPLCDELPPAEASTGINATRVAAYPLNGDDATLVRGTFTSTEVAGKVAGMATSTSPPPLPPRMDTPTASARASW